MCGGLCTWPYFPTIAKAGEKCRCVAVKARLFLGCVTFEDKPLKLRTLNLEVKTGTVPS